MRSIYLVFLFLLALPVSLMSQSYSGNDNSSRPDRQGRLSIDQDDRLEDLVRRHIKINKEREGIQGYRIRIFSQSGQSARPNANNVRANFFNKYPDIETYLEWDAPNFKVYVGDFRTRSEALKVQREINKEYPYSFIVSETISFPPLD